MKRILLTTVSALAFLALVAAPGADKKSERKVLGSRADRVTQAEMMMYSECVDGFGLDAEEYELLMSQDFDMMDDMSMTFTVPTCAGGDLPSLNGGGQGGWGEPPIIKKVTHGVVTRDDVNGGLDDQVKGNTRPGGTPSINGSRPSGAWGDQPIHSRRLFSINPGDETNGGLNGQIKGNTRPGGGTVSE